MPSALGYNWLVTNPLVACAIPPAQLEPCRCRITIWNSMYPNTLYLPELREMLSQGDDAGLREFCVAVHPAAAAEFTDLLNLDEAWTVLRHADIPTQAEIFSFYDLPKQIEFLENVDRCEMASLIAELPPDDRVDILNEADPAIVTELLPMLPEDIRRDIFLLQRYPEDTAGSLMTTDYARVSEDTTVEHAFEEIGRLSTQLETIYYLYVVDQHDHLRGVLSARDLVSSFGRPETKISELMETHVVSVDADDDSDDVADQVAKYDLAAIPVVDDEHRMLGIITHDDVIDVMREQAVEDTQRIGGLAPLEESYLRVSIPRLTWNRGMWLIFLFFGALLTALALEQYHQGPLLSASAAWLVLFIPLVISSGGNTGSQSATLIISALSAGHVSPRDWLKIILRELLQGLLLGIVLGGIGFLAALWMGPDNWIHALAIPITILLVVICGTLLGAMLPLIFEQIGWDPALMSTPFIAGIIDVVGIVIYMSVALMLISGG
ncbi:MAG TPA: magnesium transporter [Pirellulales bacterium]|nr:magnesium transporter [Pirellulales bacterium]